MSATCPGCGQAWSGTRPEHCAACHETFGGTVAGDLHRVGSFDQSRRVFYPASAGPRRCLTPDEMGEAGLRQDAKGIWRRPGPEVFSGTLEADST